MRPRSPLLRALAFSASMTLAGCGAHSALLEPSLDGGVADEEGADASPGERACPPECAVGHACCAGGCDGPPVQMPSDCCSCLPGEVTSWDCGGACGG